MVSCDPLSCTSSISSGITTLDQLSPGPSASLVDTEETPDTLLTVFLPVKSLLMCVHSSLCNLTML